MIPFLSMRQKKSAFGEVGYEKNFFPAGQRQESALNTDVMSGGTQLFCDKKVMPTRERAKKQPPSD